jgi:hypothetical protein
VTTNTAFWDAMPCSLIKIYRRFGGTSSIFRVAEKAQKSNQQDTKRERTAAFLCRATMLDLQCKICQSTATKLTWHEVNFQETREQYHEQNFNTQKLTNVERQTRTRPESLPQNVEKQKPPKQDSTGASAPITYTVLTYHQQHTRVRPLAPTMHTCVTPTYPKKFENTLYIPAPFPLHWTASVV